MLNPLVIPIMPFIGAIAANLNELVRGESTLKRTIGMKTFASASAAFASVWFMLLITAIYTGGDSNTIAGVEVLMLFLAGLGTYSAFKLGRFLTDSMQVWLYRLALPVMALGCGVVAYLG
ncbi:MULTISPECIES: hypothetical protein [Shewanella]|uniref:hypothetical protein n=1 Tax=Shewanella TaxID=22 RepID=UPI00048F7367|nr:MULTISPECIES: hypothetical protein [Shewanella]QLE85220.1 hypothetical protein FLM48_09025 [Shewanella sp. Scap07]